MSATGVGSLPGTDIVEAVRVVTGELPDLVHLPELPDRGALAGMIGRATALLAGLAADLQPAGWRLQPASGADHRRAVSLLARDLDALEEHTQGYSGRLKVQVAGPWTLAATMERPRGDRVLADHGARRELAQSLAEGVSGHIGDVQQRVPGASVLVQVDEPSLPAVMAAQVPTASGFSRHRGVQPAEVRQALETLCAAITAAGAVPVVHSCADDPPVRLLREAGFRAVSFDLSLAVPGDAWAEAYDDGVELWPGVVPALDPPASPSVASLAAPVSRWFERLGVDVQPVRIVVTPSCGLAGASPAWARQALCLAREISLDWLR